MAHRVREFVTCEYLEPPPPVEVREDYVLRRVRKEGRVLELTKVCETPVPDVADRELVEKFCRPTF